MEKAVLNNSKRREYRRIKDGRQQTYVKILSSLNGNAESSDSKLLIPLTAYPSTRILVPPSSGCCRTFWLYRS